MKIDWFTVFAYTARGIMWSLWTALTWIAIKAGATPLDFLVLLFFLWLTLPVRHPADYGSYRAWWADRRNWLK